MHSRFSYWLRDGRSGDQILVGVRFSAPTQTGFQSHTSSYEMESRPSPEVKWLGGGDVNHTPRSNAEVKEMVELCLYSHSGSSCPRSNVNFVLLDLT